MDRVAGEVALQIVGQCACRGVAIARRLGETFQADRLQIAVDAGIEDFEFGGYLVPAGLPVNYSSWASHRLPDVFEDPHSFRPQRFAPDQRAKLPKGAYVPFGGGPRICIGMRFGELEMRAIAAAILRSFRLDLEPDWQMRIRQMPTLSPRGGLPMRVRDSSA